ncbi:MAG: UvrD-helicase domain-containing protein, partial [Proteobacteria bacterium]|nr:UvrD-helicase domain-containing protein [Pseudomonadota bacterium]
MSADRGAEAILAALDEAQRRAVLHAEGPLLVSGPPGCGKTTVLAHRAAHLVTARMVAAPRCLVVTALPRAATAMRERLLRLLPDQTARIEVHTLAALALSILRQRPETAGLKSGFRVASEAERATALA